MANGYPSMLALLGLVAIAGYQNRDKIAGMIDKLGSNTNRPPGSPRGGQRGLEGLLGGLRGAFGGGEGAGADGFLRDGLGELVDRFQRSGRGDVAQSWVKSGPNQDIAPNERRHVQQWHRLCLKR